jgi:hypothetical protein
MGLEETRRVQGLAPWAGEGSLNNAKPRAEERPPRPSDPASARTPQEALAYIELLYKSGCMEDLAALLRRSAVFRQAWLTLQQTSPAGFQAVGVNSGSGNRGDTQGPAPLPVPYRASPRGTVHTEPGAGRLKAATAGLPPEMWAAARDPGVEPGLLPAGKRNHLLIAALQVYRSQDRHYLREKELAPRLSLRV